jgi:hypothetical protein
MRDARKRVSAHTEYRIAYARDAAFRAAIFREITPVISPSRAGNSPASWPKL